MTNIDLMLRATKILSMINQMICQRILCVVKLT